MGELVKLENKTEMVIMQGDLSKLTPEERLNYINAICERTGLNPLTRPFDYLTFQNRLILYARKECTEQLRKIHGVSVAITGKEVIDDIYVVSAKATDRSGKYDESTGAIVLTGLKGLDKANAMMKAETKAKRRVTLSICGLGLPDESEVDDMKAAAVAEDVTSTSSFDDEPRQKLIKVTIAKFKTLGVTEAEILNKFKVDHAIDLCDADLAELNRLGREIKNQRMTLAEAFGPETEKEF